MALCRPQEHSVLRQYDTFIAGETVVRRTPLVPFEPVPVGFISSKIGKSVKTDCDIVGALIRHVVAKGLTTALRDQRCPVFSIVFERVALERINGIFDVTQNAHCSFLCFVAEPN